MIRRSIVLALALSLPLLANAGDAPETPKQVKGGKVISVEEASKLDTMTHQNATLVEEASASAHSLADLAEQLSGMVRSFKV